MEFLNDLGTKISRETTAGLDKLSEFVADPLGASSAAVHPDIPDPTLKTAQVGEKEIRTRLEFSDLIFSFPTSAGMSGQHGKHSRIKFPAYITQFQDSFSPKWSPTEVFGRADPIPTYANTTRAINLGVLVPCFNKVDANENLKKINTLIKNLYPGYQQLRSGTRVLDSPPLVRIKFANLLINHTNPAKGLLGYITSFSTDMSIRERGVFLGTDGSSGYMFPRAIGFTMAFSPLHESTVGWDVSKAEAEFFGNNNFPYNVKNTAGEVVANPDPKVGLGAEYSLDHITKET